MEVKEVKGPVLESNQSEANDSKVTNRPSMEQMVASNQQLYNQCLQMQKRIVELESNHAIEKVNILLHILSMDNTAFKTNVKSKAEAELVAMVFPKEEPVTE